MGKASRKKHLQRQQKAALEKYNHVKLSDALMELCEPFLDAALPKSGYENLLAMAATAWNIALLPQEQHFQQILAVLEKLPGFTQDFEADIDYLSSHRNAHEDPPDSLVMMHIVGELIKRKDALYPNDDRSIVDFKLTEESGKQHLSVSSLIPGLKQ